MKRILLVSPLLGIQWIPIPVAMPGGGVGVDEYVLIYVY